MDNQTHTVLLVEDDVSLVRMYTIKLEKEGYNVLTAITGNEAFEVLEKETPDIILLDIMLPDISGLEVLKKIMDNDTLKNIPVLVLTVLPEVIALKKALKLGASGYLVKSEMTPDSVSGYIKAELNKTGTKNG